MADDDLDRVTLVTLVQLALNQEETVKYLQHLNVFPTEKECPKCHSKMRLSLVKSLWRCGKTVTIKEGKRRCDGAVAMKKHTWCSKSHLSLAIILEVTYMILYNYPIDDIIRELKLSEKSVLKWRFCIHKVLIDWALQSAEAIGGNSKTVEIIESNESNLQYKHFITGIERADRKMFMVPVTEKSSKFFTGIIKQWILPETTVVLDSWTQCLEEEDLEDLNANHRLTFVSPSNEAKTSSNSAGSFFRQAKRYLPHYNRKRHTSPGYLSHFMFFKHCRINKLEPFEAFLRETTKIDFELANLPM